jgi:predicted permease
MNEILVSSFSTTFLAVFKILMIAVIAAILVRKKIVEQEHIKGLSSILVVVLLPSLMFSNTIKSFKPDETVGWWILPLVGMGIPLLGILYSHIVFWKRPAMEKNIFAISAFPNAAYLVLPIGQVLFPNNFNEFSVYCFLFVIGFNVMLWSIGKYYITSSGNSYTFYWKELVTPPLLANITSVILVLLGLQVYIPQIILDPVAMLGSATVPTAIFVLGGTLGGISLKIWPKIIDIIRMILVKYILVPATVILVLYYIPIGNKPIYFTTLLVLEASAAPSTNLVLILRKYGGDIQQVGGLMIVGYFFSLFFMPFWIALFESLKN